MLASTRILVAALAGLLAGAIAGVLTYWQAAELIGWSVAAAVWIVWIWLSVHSLNPDETARIATREDSSRVIAELLLVSAAVTSLVGTGIDLIKASSLDGVPKALLTALAVLTVAVSWVTVQTVFMLRYAHLYYGAPIGGIDFKSNEPPDYRDFAYVAFTVGMTFQVSDTDIQARSVRRVVLQQALISYLFGAVIVASMVNVVASLVG